MPPREANLDIEVTGLREMTKQFGDLAKPIGAANFKSIGRFEATFAAAYAAVFDAVHVMTGFLKSSGVPRTNNDGDVWSGEMEFAGDPGIFELWRGDAPTLNHPEGGHGFFDKVQPFLPEFERNIDAYFEDIFKQGPV